MNGALQAAFHSAGRVVLDVGRAVHGACGRPSVPAMLRRLAAANPAAYESALSGSLNNSRSGWPTPDAGTSRNVSIRGAFVLGAHGAITRFMEPRSPPIAGSGTSARALNRHAITRLR